MAQACQKNGMNISNIPNIIAACCVRHNVCEIYGDWFNEEWLQEVNLEQPDSSFPVSSVQRTVPGGEQVHNILSDYFEQLCVSCYCYSCVYPHV